MTTLIFGIVVMLVTWWICRKDIKENNQSVEYLEYRLDEYCKKINNLIDENNNLKSELIVQKSMRD